MISGNEIQSLVNLLEERQVSLYHACQLLDFESYLALGGIPSRALLESRELPFTPFDTDTNDKANGVWDKVFGNLVDFGEIFANGRPWPPTVYGSIQLQIKPSVLLEGSDIAICIRSAGGEGFNRESEALTIDEIDRVFRHPRNAPFPESTDTKSLGRLAEEFGKTKPQHPEISCSVPNQVLSAEYIIVAWIDPYVLNGHRLLDRVSNVVKNRQEFNFRVISRSCKEKSRIHLYNEIAECIREEIPSLSDLTQDSTLSSTLREYARQVLQNSEAVRQFNRYIKYLLHGTLRPMRTRAISD
ncbi:MAG: hypothetical protein OXC79_00800 [Candidatus Poribacteria bacterium]|nr:hypothetical protein [Candidatus Poribacteria bacterium]